MEFGVWVLWELFEFCAYCEKKKKPWKIPDYKKQEEWEGKGMEAKKFKKSHLR